MYTHKHAHRVTIGYKCADVIVIILTCIPSSQELAVDKANLDEVNALALRLITEGHSGAHIIEEYQATLNTRYITKRALFHLTSLHVSCTLYLEC